MDEWQERIPGEQPSGPLEPPPSWEVAVVDGRDAWVRPLNLRATVVVSSLRGVPWHEDAYWFVELHHEDVDEPVHATSCRAEEAVELIDLLFRTVQSPVSSR
jgi:hypothetical protein